MADINKSMEKNDYNTIEEGVDQENPKIDINTSTPTNNTVSNNEKKNSIVENTSNKIVAAAGSIKGFFKRAITGETSEETTASSDNKENEPDCRTKALIFMQQKVEVETNYKTFIIMISIGAACFCLSLVFLPMVVIAPRKFVSCFSMGCLLILTSFLFYYGTKAYFQKLCAKERFIFTSSFFGSIFLGIFCAILNEFFFLSLLCAAVQLLSLIVFVLSFIPGGQTGISAIGGIVLAPAKRLWSSVKGENSNSSGNNNS